VELVLSVKKVKDSITSGYAKRADGVPYAEVGDAQERTGDIVGHVPEAPSVLFARHTDVR
jgi:hypothetical protein